MTMTSNSWQAVDSSRECRAQPGCEKWTRPLPNANCHSHRRSLRWVRAGKQWATFSKDFTSLSEMLFTEAIALPLWLSFVCSIQTAVFTFTRTAIAHQSHALEHEYAPSCSVGLQDSELWSFDPVDASLYLFNLVTNIYLSSHLSTRLLM